MSKDVLVKEVMKTNLVIVQPFTSVLEAARLMKENKIGDVSISEVNHPIGILTESDIIKKVVCEAKNAQDLLVEEVMSSPIIVTEPYAFVRQHLHDDLRTAHGLAGPRVRGRGGRQWTGGDAVHGRARCVGCGTIMLRCKRD